MRAIAARLGRSPSTISREVGRNSRGRRCYRALAAQGHAEHRAARPKTAKLAGNAELRGWVQDKREENLPGAIRRSLTWDQGTEMTNHAETQSLRDHDDCRRG